MRSLLVAAVSLVCVAGTSCGADAQPRSTPIEPGCTFVEEGYGPDGTVPVQGEVVVDGLEVPWGIAFLPDGGMLVTERPGRIRRVTADRKLLPDPVANVPVAAQGEGGLLGIALHPRFADNREFFVYVTVDAPRGVENRVLRFRLEEDGRSATRLGVLLEGIPAARFHNGGRLRTGPDGMLWISTGDAREPALAQRRDSLAGKLLRITAGGEVPPDNPFPDSPVFLLGLRNLQAFDWITDGRLAVADHGPSGEFGLRGRDEVSVASEGDNLGWPVVVACGGNEGMVSPAIAWDRAVPPGGAAFYRGSRIPEWKGALLVGTLRSEHLHLVRFDAEGNLADHAVYLRGEWGRLREVITGPDGELYLTTSNCDGRGECPPDGDKVLRIVPAAGGGAR